MQFKITTTYREPKDEHEASELAHRRQRALELLAELVHKQLLEETNQNGAPAAVQPAAPLPSDPALRPTRQQPVLARPYTVI